MKNSKSSKKKNALYIFGGLSLIAFSGAAIYLGAMITKTPLSNLAYYLLFFASLIIVGSIIAAMYYHKSNKINEDIEKIDPKKSDPLFKFKTLYMERGYRKVKKLINIRWSLRIMMAAVIIFALVVFNISALIRNFGDACIYGVTFLLVLAIVFSASALISKKIKNDYIECDKIMESAIKTLTADDLIDGFKIYSAMFEERKNCSQNANFGQLEMSLDFDKRNDQNNTKVETGFINFVKNVFFFIFGSNHNPIEENIISNEIIEKRFDNFIKLGSLTAIDKIEFKVDLKAMQDDYSDNKKYQEHPFVSSIIRLADKFVGIDRHVHELFE